MVKAVHGLDRQAGGVQMGVVRQENGRTQILQRKFWKGAKNGTGFQFYPAKFGMGKKIMGLPYLR